MAQDRPIWTGVSTCGKMKAVRSCGVLVIKRLPTGAPDSFLLLKQPKRFDLPKGHREPGEEDDDTAFRELLEETGIQRNEVTLIPGFQHSETYYPKYSRFGGQTVEKKVTLFAAYLNEGVEPTIKLTEHVNFEWVKWSPPHNIQKNTIDPLLKSLEAHLSK